MFTCLNRIILCWKNSTYFCFLWTITIRADKHWLNVIKHYYEKIVVNILRKYSLIIVDILPISYLYCIHYFMFSVWWWNIFLMSYSCLLWLFFYIFFIPFEGYVKNMCLVGFLIIFAFSLPWLLYVHLALMLWMIIGALAPHDQKSVLQKVIVILDRWSLVDF